MNLIKTMAVTFTGLFISASAMAVPMTVGDFGDLDGDSAVVGGTLASGEIQWYSFSAADFTYLDITTNGSNPAYGTDTELGLYDAAGNFVGTNDDSGGFLDSLLSYGVGSGNDYGFGDEGLGQDGALADGSYFIAVGLFNSSFGATYMDVTGGSDGDYVLSIFTDAVAPSTDVPEPGVLALLGLGLLGFGLARRT